MKNPFRNLDSLPIRIKLTVWYTFSFMIVLAFSFGSFFLVTKNLMQSKIDDSLSKQAQEISNLIKDQQISPLSKGLVLKTFQISKNNFVMVLNQNGEIITQSLDFPVSVEFLEQIKKEYDETPNEKYFSYEGIRYFVLPLFTNDNFIGFVVVGDSMATINDAFGVLVGTLFLVFFLFLLPLILVSFLEADISLSPLRDLAKKMNEITTKNLSSRVDVLNPKDEIGEVSLAFNSLLDRLQKGFEKERQLIHDVSHQLKTPLTAMRSEIEISLTKNRDCKNYRQVLKNLLSDASRMDSLLKDMMNFAWASSDDQEKTFKKENLSQILNEVAEISQQVAQAKHLELTFNIEENIFILGQREKLFQIFMNLLENAIKYSKKHGKILIKVTAEETMVNIIIKDNGIGIAKKDLPHIFERFYRVSQNHTEGSGLGLSIASALTKAHKGTIEVASVKGLGTTFVIKLPILKLKTTHPMAAESNNRFFSKLKIKAKLPQLPKSTTKK